jgi:hypothetical protein
MTGPIRPNEEVFLENIKKVRDSFKTAKIYFLTWRYHDQNFVEKISHFFDLFLSVDEPDESYLLEKYPMTIQQSSIFDEEYKKVFTSCMHKMFLSNRFIIEILDQKKILQDDDIVLRYRSDLFVDIDFEKNHLSEINNNVYYMNNRDHGGDDWFGICNYQTYKKIWNNSDEIYCDVVKNCFNAESMISRFCHIHSITIQHLKFKSIYVNKPAGKVFG